MGAGSFRYQMLTKDNVSAPHEEIRILGRYQNWVEPRVQTLVPMFLGMGVFLYAFG
ncbi:hypothetical protein J21TS3_29620 [Paenibacillus cookii]|jgi:hypothetical protein|uniref:Uncharacterized protein n=1 Tax=Paenibacillus cookii TaxID=157839 RepID=A0ABQ4LXY8_9BACL|nr:hypothetical protein J21TS3_29620 [Paenibacillus cookii]